MQLYIVSGLVLLSVAASKVVYSRVPGVGPKEQRTADETFDILFPSDTSSSSSFGGANGDLDATPRQEDQHRPTESGEDAGPNPVSNRRKDEAGDFDRPPIHIAQNRPVGGSEDDVTNKPANRFYQNPATVGSFDFHKRPNRFDEIRPAGSNEDNFGIGSKRPPSRFDVSRPGSDSEEQVFNRPNQFDQRPISSSRPPNQGGSKKPAGGINSKPFPSLFVPNLPGKDKESSESVESSEESNETESWPGFPGGKPNNKEKTTQSPVVTGPCSCFATPEYNPVCGTDNQTYNNPKLLECARLCNRSPGVQLDYPAACIGRRRTGF